MSKDKKTDINKKVVAIEYNPLDAAPKIVAKGKGYMADRILKNAQTSGVKTYKDEKLVDELTKIDIGSSIPPALYEVVAQVLVFIDRLDKLQEYKLGEK